MKKTMHFRRSLVVYLSAVKAIIFIYYQAFLITASSTLVRFKCPRIEPHVSQCIKVSFISSVQLAQVFYCYNMSSTSQRTRQLYQIVPMNLPVQVYYNVPLLLYTMPFSLTVVALSYVTQQLYGIAPRFGINNRIYDENVQAQNYAGGK